MNAIEVQHLTKTFGKTTALSDISFSVAQGEIFGAIGPDGAGKSTLIRSLATLALPDFGTIQMLGMDLLKDYKTIRTKIGYMPEIFSLYQDLTVEENLEFYASLFDISIADNFQIIEPVFRQLEPFRKRRAGKLSGGMKQKLALSCALIHNPQILLLDEPTRGVDPVSRKEFWNILGDIKKQGITIVFSTSYMDEVGICDKIGLFSKGKFLRIGAPDAIAAEFADPIYLIKSAQLYKVLLKARQWEGTKQCYMFGDSIHIVFKNGGYSAEGLKAFLAEFADVEVSVVEANIEDCFMNLLNSERHG